MPSHTSITDPHPHAPNSVGGAQFRYDDNGNMTTGLGGKLMTYDAENRVKTATLGGVETVYVYGADGTRIKRRVNNSTTLTLGPIEVRNYRAASGEELLLYPTPWFRTSGGSMAAFHRDQVDSIQLITGAGGGSVKETTYQPFGEARDAVVDTPISPVETEGYIGERFDEAPELQFLNARYYDPELSLFTSSDWLEVTDPGVGTNRYAYAGNSPLNNRDPSGNLWNNTAFSRGWDSVFGEGSWDSTTIGGMNGSDLDDTVAAGGAGAVIGANAGFGAGAAAGCLAGCGVSVVSTPVGGGLGGLIGFGLGATIGFGIDVAQEFIEKTNIVNSENPEYDKPSLVEPDRAKHILDGDRRGGGHRYGTGIPGKQEFPQGWSDDKILGEISDVATDPSSTPSPGNWDTRKLKGRRDGVDIEVIVKPDGRIITGYPTNLNTNP